MKLLCKRFSLAAIGVLLSVNSAWALGSLITADGTTITASRTLVVRHADEMQIVTQVKYGAATDNFIWLLAIPNFNHPVDDGVRAEAFPSAALDELDALSRPVLQGACDGTPNGMSQDVIQANGFGPGLDMRPATQFYSAAEISAGELGNYVTGQGFEIDEATQTMIDSVVNKNLMLVAIRVDVGALGTPRVDPVISLKYPAPRDSRQGLAVQTVLPNVTAGAADLVVWVLDTNRAKMISRTVPLEFEDVAFISVNETNYVAAMETQLAMHQTRMTVVEFAGTLDPAALENAALSEAITTSGSSFLTRLHTRITPPAIRAETQAQGYISIRTDPGGDYSREHQISGFGCAEMPSEDAGMMMAMNDAGETDAEMSEGDGGLGPITAADGGGADASASSGGSSGGCAIGTDNSSLPLLLLFVLGLFPVATRRTRQ
jgi:hypothetical protein